jgi:3-phenylpropionate/trans-cinnamate dioxygenase ferredoxin component
VIPIGSPPRSEESDPARGFVDVLAVEALPPGGQRSVLVGFTRVLLCHVGERIYAVGELCPHALQPLAGGEIRDGAIRCPKHGARFDLETGRPLNGVTVNLLRTYPLRIRQGRIEIALGAPLTP